MNSGSLLRAQSQPGLAMSSEDSVALRRQELERSGLLVRRGEGQIADGMGGLRPRKHSSLSSRKNVYLRSVSCVETSASAPWRAVAQRRKNWNKPMESRAPVDLKRILPVPRGGWGSLPQVTWPEPEAAGRRDLREIL